MRPRLNVGPRLSHLRQRVESKVWLVPLIVTGVPTLYQEWICGRPSDGNIRMMLTLFTVASSSRASSSARSSSPSSLSCSTNCLDIISTDSTDFNWCGIQTIIYSKGLYSSFLLFFVNNGNVFNHDRLLIGEIASAVPPS